MLPSLILNALNIVFVAGCLIRGLIISSPKRVLFRYFTTLSNVLCAIASLIVVIMQLCGGLPFWALLIKYVGTAAVTVTMFTVLLLLGPVSHEWKLLLTRGELFLHLICPLLAIVSFLAFEKTAMPAWVIPIGILPVLLYGMLYLNRVILAPEKDRWDDFYGFNKKGKWPRSFVMMVLGTALIAFLLWIINNG